MKTLACFVVTWVTATILLLWIAHHQDTTVDLGGAQLTFSGHGHTSREFWRCVWIAALYSIVNTFIVRFWQMQSELRKKD